MRVSRKLLFFFIMYRWLNYCITSILFSFFNLEFLFLFYSLTEIQNARGIMDVLAEMLSAIDPGNKEVYLSI